MQNIKINIANYFGSFLHYNFPKSYFSNEIPCVKRIPFYIRSLRDRTSWDEFLGIMASLNHSSSHNALRGDLTSTSIHMGWLFWILETCQNIQYTIQTLNSKIDFMALKWLNFLKTQFLNFWLNFECNFIATQKSCKKIVDFRP